MTEHISSPNIKTLHTYDTVYSADSVEWCPHEPNQHYFVCANYQLVEPSESNDNTTKRIGKIHLFSIHPQQPLKLHQTINTAAILDQKWCHNKINDYSILGVVNADNQLEIYKLFPDNSELKLITSISNEDDDTMMLSLDWSTGKYCDNEPMIVVSDTKGKIHLFKFANNELEKQLSLNGHEFEAWICAFNYWNTSMFFSGGDDSKFLQFDIRVGKNPIFKSKEHTAGVTCIHSNKEKENILATGSYDQNLNLWDIRKLKIPLQSLKMPGPMWRLKWDPRNHNHLLAACMLGGFHIVDTKSELIIVANYYEHSDLAYGSDWSYLNELQVKDFDGYGNRIIATCSFYDHKMCVANVDLDFEINE